MLKCRFHNLATLILAIVPFLAGPSAFAQNGSITPNYTGFLDHAGCDSLSGWAADTNRLGTSILVSIAADGQPIASITAALLRSDVGSALGDNGMHGFSLPTPAILLDGHTHTIRVTFESSASDLIDSPVSLTCAALPVPPLCADVFVTLTPPYGIASTHTNHYCRDRSGRTRYDYGRFSTINDPVSESTIVLDTASWTYTVTSWNPSFAGGDQPYDYATAADLATPAPPPPPRNPAGCPTGNEGWSVTAHPANTGGTATDQVVNVWACPSLVLPMYVQIIDPVLGKTDLDYDNIVRNPEPDPALFTVPPGYSQNRFLSLSTGAPNCPPEATLDPVVVVSTNAQPGEAVMTSLTNGAAGCYFVDSTITVGRSISAYALSPRYLPIFQLLVQDNQNPQYTNSVDFARVTLTASDGSTSNELIIRVAIH